MLVVTASLVVPQVTQAGIGESIGDLLVNIVSWLLYQIIYVFSQLLLIAISILIKVAGFNEFVDANVVQIGWVIMRDVANLIIVIALLIIAFYTTINKKSYHYQTMLPKLILAAILVNFSKSIAGILIDLSQVLMMYFVHAFESIAAGNITYGFGIEDIIGVSKTLQGVEGAEVNDWTVLGSVALGVILVTFALGVIVSMAIMLLARIVRIWLLIIFSPLAYVSNLIPGGLQGLSSKWWGDFSKQLTFGPTLAFLFWLAMSVLSQITHDNHLVKLELDKATYLQGTTGSAVDYAYFASQISSPQRIFDYMVTAALLIFCMVTAKQAGVAGSQYAGKIHSRIDNAGRWIARRPQVWGQRGLKRAGESYAGQGVRALVQRGRETKLGKVMGLDKEHKESQLAKKRAWAEERIGGQKGAIERNEWTRAMVAMKKADEAGAFKNEKTTQDFAETAIKKGNRDEAIAGLQRLAKDKNLTPEMAKRFQEKFAEGKNKDEQQRFMGYINTAWDTQSNAGDKTVDFNRTVAVDDLGNYVERSDEDNAKAITKAYSGKETRELFDATTIKAISKSDRKNKAVHKLFNIAADRDDHGLINAQNRRDTIELADEILADDNNKAFLDDKTKKDILKTRNILVGIDTGEYKYNTRNGRLVNSKDVEEVDKLVASGGLIVKDKETGKAVKHEKKEDSDNYLAGIYSDLVKDEIKKGKKERFLGTREESKMEKAIKRDVLANLDLEDDLKKIFERRQQIITEQDEDQKKVFINKYKEEVREFTKNLKKQMSNKKVKVVDPTTGKRYDGDALVGEFEKTGIHDNLVQNYTQEDTDALINSMDNLIIDLETSYNWKKMFSKEGHERFAVNRERELMNNPKFKQKMIQKTLVSSKKLNTGLDNLEKPQTESKRLRRWAAKTHLISGESVESRRVKKIIQNLDVESGFNQDPELRGDVDKLYDLYNNYKKTHNIDLIKEMKEIAERISDHYET